MRCDLIEPLETPRAGIENDQRVRVERGTRERPSIRPVGTAAPGPRVRVPRVEAAGRIDRDRIPRSTSAGLERIAPRRGDGVELPAHVARRPVEGIDCPPAARREADRTDEDDVVPGDRRNLDELLRRARQMPLPQLTTRRLLEGESPVVGDAVHPCAVDREPVRSAVPGPVPMRPMERPVRSIEREYAALEIERVDRVVVHDRSCREDAGVARHAGQGEPPLLLQVGDVSCVDPGAGGGARAREVGVRKRPRAGARVAPAPGETADQHPRSDGKNAPDQWMRQGAC